MQLQDSSVYLNTPAGVPYENKQRPRAFPARTSLDNVCTIVVRMLIGVVDLVIIDQLGVL